jgi:hypothetical protein
MPFGFIDTKTLNYLAFQSFYFKRRLMKVIPETRRTTKFDIYFFIDMFLILVLMSWLQ